MFQIKPPFKFKGKILLATFDYRRVFLNATAQKLLVTQSLVLLSAPVWREQTEERSEDILTLYTMDHVLTADHHMLKDLFRFLISIQNTKTIVATPLRVPKALPPKWKIAWFINLTDYRYIMIYHGISWYHDIYIYIYIYIYIIYH